MDAASMALIRLRSAPKARGSRFLDLSGNRVTVHVRAAAEVDATLVDVAARGDADG